MTESMRAMPGFTIEEAVAEQHAEIGRLCAHVIEAHVTSEPQLLADTVGNVDKNLAIWLREPARCLHLVAVSEGRVVAAALVKDHRNLCTLFVASGLQGLGIGRTLLNEVSSRCRGRSEDGLLVLNAAPHAIAFYRRLGFTERAASRPLPPGFMAMQLRL